MMKFVIALLVFAIPILLSAQVDTAWVRTYDGPAHSIDGARYIALDNSGFIYVTGSSSGGSSLNDFCTIKYNANGDSLWVSRFDGGSSDDIPYGLFVDNAGFVYIAGHAFIPSVVNDFFVVKYDASNGDTVWTTRIPNMSSGSNGKYTKILHVDDIGNVYVTGTGSGAQGIDYLTVKMNSNGDTLWTRRYGVVSGLPHNAAGLAVDNQGNVYVTGASWSAMPPGGSIDFGTIKYNSTGQEQWVATYDGPGNNTDYAYAVEADNSGNVYVTGSCFTGGAVNTDFCTIKYDAATGDTVWTRRYGSPNYPTNTPSMISLTGAGDIYVAGSSYGGSPGSGGTGTDYALLKYNSAGVLQWDARYNGGGAGEDYANDFSIDSQGNIYLTGKSVGGLTYQDFCTVKFNSSGEQQWVARYDAGVDEATAIAVAAPDTLYVAGKNGASDFVTIKYVPAAKVIVTPTRFSFFVQGGGTDAGVLTIANSAPAGASELSWNLVDREFPRQSTGREKTILSTGEIVYQLAYPAGTDELNGLAWGDNALWATDLTNSQVLKLDAVTGAVLDSFSIPGSFPCDLAHDGNYLWYFDYSANQIHKIDPASGAILQTIANPLSGGEGMTTDGYFLYRGGGDSTIFKFDASGIVVDTIPAPQGWCQGLAWSDSILWYSSGSRLYQIDPDSGQVLQYFYAPAGTAEGGMSFDGQFLRYCQNQTDLIYSIDIEFAGTDAAWLSENPTGGNISAGSSQDVDITVIAAGLDSGTYAGNLILSSNDPDAPQLVIPVELNVDVPQGVGDPSDQAIYRFQLEQNYPNPFNPATTIYYEVPLLGGRPGDSHAARVRGGFVMLKVYDILGREVATLLNERKPPGKYQVQWDAAGFPSGIYFYRLTAGARNAVKKMLLIK